MKIEYKKIYVAKDGKKFDTEEACLKHEMEIPQTRFFVVLEDPCDDGCGSIRYKTARMISVHTDIDGLAETIARHYEAFVLHKGVAMAVAGIHGLINPFKIELSDINEFVKTKDGDELPYFHAKIKSHVVLSESYETTAQLTKLGASPVETIDYTRWDDFIVNVCGDKINNDMHVEHEVLSVEYDPYKKYQDVVDGLVGKKNDVCACSLLSDGEHAFISNGIVNADGIGVLIGFSDGKLCRCSGLSTFQKDVPLKPASDKEINELMNLIMVSSSIPFYSCI